MTEELKTNNKSGNNPPDKNYTISDTPSWRFVKALDGANLVVDEKSGKQVIEVVKTYKELTREKTNQTQETSHVDTTAPRVGDTKEY